MNLKKHMLFWLVLVVMVVMSSATAYLAPATGKEAVVRISVTTGLLAKALPPFIEKFNNMHKGEIRVEIDAQSLSGLLEKYMSQFITKKPTYDIVSVDTRWSSRLQRFLYPLNPLIKNDKLDVKELFGAKAINARSSKRGEITSIPVSSNAHILFYRTDLFKEAGLSVPKTLDEYLNAARKLTKRSGNGDVEIYGMGGLRSLQAGDDAPTLSYFLQPHGGRVLNPKKTDASPDLKRPVTIEVLQFLSTLAKEGLCPNPLSWDQYADRSAFLQGKLAMTLGYTDQNAPVEDPSQSKVAGKVGYALIQLDHVGSQPSTAFASGWGLGIDKNSPNKKEAWEFIKFITVDYNNQKSMAMTGLNNPSLLQIMNEPEYVNKIQSAKVVKEIMTTFGFDMPSDVEQGTGIEAIIHEELQMMYSGKKTPQQVANALYDRIHKLMTEK